MFNNSPKGLNKPLKQSKHSPKSLNIPRKSKQSTLLWVAAPPGGKPPRKTYLVYLYFYVKMLFWASRQHFLMVLTCSWVSWPKNDAERSRNYFKKSVLDPKHVKFDQNPSFGHVRAVGGIMGYSGSVNFKHLLRSMCTDSGYWHSCAATHTSHAYASSSRPASSKARIKLIHYHHHHQLSTTVLEKAGRLRIWAM